MTDTADWEPTGVYQADRAYASVRPRLSFADFLLQLWRAKWRMVAAAAPILVIGLLFASQLPTMYQSKATLYVASSQDEVQLLRTRVVAERAISRFQISRLYPQLARAQQRALQNAKSSDAAAAMEYRYFQRAVARFQSSFEARVADRSNVIQVSVTHTNPEIAAELLNATIAAYINRRTELFPRGAGREEHTGRKQAEGELLDAEAAIRAFLDANNIRNFANEQATAQALQSAVSSEIVVTQSRQKAVAGRLAKTRAQMTETPRQIDLFVDDDSARRLLELEIARSQALITYTPESQRVRTIDQQISELKALLAAQDGPIGTVRRGPNPVYQALETSRNELEAEATSLSVQAAELVRQLQAVEAKLDRFGALATEWSELQRARTDLARRVDDLRQSERVTGANGMSLAAGVKITEPATVPIQRKSMKGLVVTVTCLLALMAAVLVGFVRALSRPAFSTAGSLQRTTGLPVFGATSRA